MKFDFKQVKFGAILSYILMILNMLYGLWITPFLINNLGTDEYGLYKLVGSLSSSLLVLNLGIGDTVQRYVATYLAEDERKKIPNLMAMCIIITIVLNFIIFVVGAVIIFVFPHVYGHTLTIDQLSKARVLLAILIVNIMVTVIENLFSGLLIGFNDYIFTNSIKVLTVLIRAVLVYFAISKKADSIGLATITLVLSCAVLIAEFLYGKQKLNVIIRYSFWDKNLFKEAGKYTALMFLTALASQAVTNIDTIVIGAVLGTAVVTMYSVGQYFFNLFQQLSCGVSGVMLPTVTMALHEDDGMQRVEQVVIGAGRVQFALLGAALAGIICVGKEFILLWLGEGYEDVYILIMILVIPTMFELCTNVCLSILRAQNKIAFRTYVVFTSAVINSILTVVLVNVWSYMGAAIATAFSYISCSLIAMNIYYVKVIKLRMGVIYKGIIRRIWICIILPSIATIVLSKFFSGTWLLFAVKVLFFCFIYGILLLVYGLDSSERSQVPIIGQLFSYSGEKRNEV